MFKTVRRWLAGTPRQERDIKPDGPTSVRGAVPAPGAAAIERMPGSPYSEGICAYEAGDYHAAARCFQAAINAHHDEADLHDYLGRAQLELGRLEDAADSFVMATHFDPAHARAWYNLGLTAQRRDDHRDAVNCFEHAIGACSSFADAHNALGASFLVLGDARRAADCFETAVKVDPGHAKAHSNLGYVLFRDFGEHDRGASHIRTAVSLNRDEPNFLCNYSMVLAHEGRLHEAIGACDEVLSIRPGLSEARLNRALALLRLGQFGCAWPDYEARKVVRSNYIQRPYRFSEWQGEPLAGKTILVYAEQGLGDEIMFSSCLPDVLVRGARCVFECSPRLRRLFERSFPDVTVHGVDQSADTGWWQHAGQIDFQIAAGSLPGHFRRQWSDFPRHSGYLRADPSRVEYWRNRVTALGAGLKVGISWRGGMPSTRGNLRSTDLEAWLPIMRVSGVHFISLQYGDASAEAMAFAKAHGCSLHHWQDAIDDLDETAALVCALDIVVSVQTACVHIAGALGRPTWVLVPAVPEWRYLQEGDSMPWYPSVRLLRQSRSGDWAASIAAVASRLSAIPAIP